MKLVLRLALLAFGVLPSVLVAQDLSARANAMVTPGDLAAAGSRPGFEYGVLISGGNGLTDQRNGYHFLQAGVHFGRVLTGNIGKGALRGNFEYAVELFPYTQAFTPRYQRVACVATANSALFTCSQPYYTGGTYTGVELRPIILRYNLARHGRVVPWAQAAGGVLYTTHKFPAYGDTTQNLAVNGPSSETSVWNFTPQGGIGLHYFTSARRSIDFSANAEHISSASLGDRNPGVNASVQFTLGYSWWK